MSQLRVFLIHAGTSYLLLVARFLGTFVLRLLADPVTVGVINSVQVVAPIFSALTTGTIYTALRSVPTQNAQDQQKTTWSHIVANMLEGFALVIPFVLFASFTLQHPQEFRYLLLIAAGFYVLSQRLFGLLESTFMALSRVRLVVRLRFLHIIELVMALYFVSELGAIGYFAVTPMIALLMLYLTVRNLPFPPLDWNLVSTALKPTRYAGALGVEKLLSTIASSLDGLCVSILLGPASLAGYYLGVTVRGAFSTLINSLFWSLWPKAVRDQDAKNASVFSDSKLTIRIGGIAVIFTVITAESIRWILIEYLPKYMEAIPSIFILVAGIVPIVLSEWARSQLVVTKHTSILPWATITKIAAFLLVVTIGSRERQITPEFIASAAFVSIFIQMIIISKAALDVMHSNKTIRMIVLTSTLSLTPLLIFLHPITWAK